MNESTLHGVSRREFLAGASMLGATTLLGLPRTAIAEPPPETTKIRIVQSESICLAPQQLAEELLHLEGFAEVEYVKYPGGQASSLLAAGRADFTMQTVPGLILRIDAGEPVVLIAGVHAGCYELFGNQRIQSVLDLKDQRVAVSAIGDDDHVFMSSIMAYVGMDPRTDIEWITSGTRAESMRMFVEGKVDAFLGFPPQPQEVRAKKIGHVIVNTTLDRPWSQYFCCIVAARRGFANEYPNATKRALRAFLKAADICAQEPERAARYLVAKGYEPRYEIGLEVLKSLPYNRWREASAEDSLRFHALRLHEAGLIKSTPQQIVARGSNWRFLNELKKELRA
ncbi:MAG TPA: ABC transporter substrate-binding protein [Burkholderiales bacterium]|nr:ABC transporter substrate-binding protein [Burkholderiales bacterium]